MQRIYAGVEDVLEPSELCHPLQPWCGYDLVRGTVGDDSSCLEHQHPLSNGEHFFTAVCNVENWNTTRVIPGTQVIENARLCGQVES